MSEELDFVRGDYHDGGDAMSKSLAALNEKETEAARRRRLDALEAKKRLYGVGSRTYPK